MSQKILFKVPENDPFVKSAMANIVYILDKELSSIQYNDQEVKIDDNEVDNALDIIYDEIFKNSISRTHRLSRPAKEVNNKYKEINDEMFFDNPKTYFPNQNEDSTQFEDNRISPEDISSVTPLDTEFDFDSERAIYRLRESYVGNTGYVEFEGALDRAEQSYDVFSNVLIGNLESDDVCSCCGRSDMITSSINQELDVTRHYNTDKDQEESVNSGSKAYRVEFGQSMTPYMTKSGSTRPCGIGKGDSYIEGRCASCVFLGFYYTLMKKPMDVISYSDSNFHILCPTGKFTDLVNISKILDNELKDLTEGDTVRARTLDLIRTESDNAKYIHFFEKLRKGFEKSESLTETTMLPIGVISVYTTTDKSNQGVRGFKSFEIIDSQTRIPQIIEPYEVKIDDIVEKVDPISDLVIPFIDFQSGDNNEPGVEFKDIFCEGIIKNDLDKVERGAFNIFKTYHSNKESLNGNLYSPTRLSNYTNKVMNIPEKITDEQLKAIRNVGSSLGQEFHNEMSVMISLQNASSQSQFLQAFEKAGMQAFKKGSSSASESGYTPHTNDIEHVVKLLTDEETFEVTKKLIVIHASFSGHYENLNQNKGDQND